MHKILKILKEYEFVQMDTKRVLSICVNHVILKVHIQIFKNIFGMHEILSILKEYEFVQMYVKEY
jgi:hypothetical protein